MGQIKLASSTGNNCKVTRVGVMHPIRGAPKHWEPAGRQRSGLVATLIVWNEVDRCVAGLVATLIVWNDVDRCVAGAQASCLLQVVRDACYCDAWPERR